MMDRDIKDGIECGCGVVEAEAIGVPLQCHYHGGETIKEEEDPLGHELVAAT